MRTLYEAENTVEAHMILNLLEQAGISGRIDGEYLQGGIGELQAFGLVRVMVEDNDYSEAKAIIKEWDSNQPKRERSNKSSQNNSRIGSWMMGFIIGVTIMAIYYHTPVTEEGIDYNGDGAVDEKWIYINDRISKAELDRNFDKKVDFVYLFDRKGIIESASSDQDFNGTFETEAKYKNGNIIWQESDTTGDGFNDYRIDYSHGVIESITFINPNNAKAIKVQRFDPFKVSTSEVDTTGNGVMDTQHHYDSIEEIYKTYHK